MIKKISIGSKPKLDNDIFSGVSTNPPQYHIIKTISGWVPHQWWIFFFQELSLTVMNSSYFVRFIPSTKVARVM